MHVKVGKRPRPESRIVRIGRKLSLLLLDPFAASSGSQCAFCPPGQTEAAQDVFSGIPASKRKNYIQEGVGHYGVFSGSRFQKDIYPVIRDWIHEAAGVDAREEIPIVQ